MVTKEYEDAWNATNQMESQMSACNSKVVGVRLEDLMKGQLAEMAKKNDRSLSKEIVSRLRKSLEQEDVQFKRA